MFVLDLGKVGNHQGTPYTMETPLTNADTNGKLTEMSLQELTPGKMFAGEVVSVGKDRVLLRLDNGQTIQAGVNGNIPLTEGQMLAFLVKSNTGRQLAIKPMFDVNVENSSVLKALQNAGIPVNSKNAELVNLLMKEQMPIDKESIIKFLRQMKLHPDTDVKTLVQLHKMGLYPNEENIARFESYQNHEYRLSEKVSDVAADIVKLIGENTSEQKNPVDVFGKIADIVFPESEETRDSIQATLGKKAYESRNVTSMQEGPVLYEKLKSESMLNNNEKNLTNVQKQALENIETIVERFQGQETEMEHIVESLQNLNEEAQGIVRLLEDDSKINPMSSQKQDMMSKLFAAFEMYETAEKSMEAAKTALNSSEYQLPEESAVFKERSLAAVTEIQTELDENGRMELAHKLQKAGGDIMLSLQVRQGEIQPKELVRAVRQIVQQLNQTIGQSETAETMQLQEKMTAVRELLQSDEFRTVCKSAIEEEFLLKPEQINKENVKEYYERLSQKMNQFTEMIQQMGKEDASAMKHTTAIRQNVEYMNQLNQIYSYVQLPVKLTNQNAHSELYVLTNKKRLGEKEGAFTALLHLDMELLGSMDVYITMEKKKVNARFYLQREEIAEFMESHSEPLIKQLEEKGFLVKAGFEKKPEEKDMVDEFANNQKDEQVISKYSFDIRT